MSKVESDRKKDFFTEALQDPSKLRCSCRLARLYLLDDYGLVGVCHRKDSFLLCMNLICILVISYFTH